MVSRGHRAEDLISVYTLDQFWYYHRAALRNYRRELLDQASGMRLAFAGQKDWQKFVKAMTEEDRPKKKDAATLPKERLGEVRKLLSGK
jgi:hypothetical protein